MKSKRMANIELLRILAMIFVVTLHYLGKGGVPMGWGTPENNMNTWFAWAIQAFALVAVNVYVIIGGYFLVESSFKISRIVKLWCQVFFYSAGVWVVFLMLGQVPADYANGYWISMFLLPITSAHYWFASTYIFMCLLAPFMALAARNMTKKQLQTCIAVLLILFSRVWRILLPMSTPIDDRGYGILWFVTLFMIASYIRLHVPANGKWKKPLLLYVISSVCLFLSLPVIGVVTQKIGKMEGYYNVFFEYNAPFTIIGAIALFLAFRNMNIKSVKAGKVISLFSGATFGVYLFHEHTLLKWKWNDIWDVQHFYQTPYFLLHCVVAVLGVYLAGTIVDWARQLLLACLGRVLRIFKIDILFSKIVHCFHGLPKQNGDKYGIYQSRRKE